jgi:hypothetical protein
MNSESLCRQLEEEARALDACKTGMLVRGPRLAQLLLMAIAEIEQLERVRMRDTLKPTSELTVKVRLQMGLGDVTQEECAKALFREAFFEIERLEIELTRMRARQARAKEAVERVKYLLDDVKDSL